MKIIDRYIIRKFLGTFFYALGLMILIAVIFDMSEKMDDFIEKKAPLKAVVFDYYLNFMPYFANLVSPTYVYIAVIYVTSRMASQTEIVAILNGGMSFNRLIRPYFIAAAFLALLSFYLNGWVIPHANKTRLEFENAYIRNPFTLKERNIHRQISPGTLIYMESYNARENIGFRFSLASRKVRGGIGFHLGVGIALSFAYIVFMQIGTTYASKGEFPPLLSVWIPNIIFAAIAYYLFRKAPK